jgi:Protein of unknown function (DUF2786).
MRNPLERVTKLLAHAESAAAAGSEKEAETYFSAAAYLIYKYDLQEAVRKRREERAIEIDEYWIDISNAGRHGPERVQGVYVVVLTHGCTAVTRGNRRDSTGPIQLGILGPADVVTGLKLLIPSLLLQMEGVAESVPPYYARKYKLTPDQMIAFRRGLYVGYGSGVAARIEKKIRLAQETAGHSAALILADRTARVQAAAAERWHVRNMPPFHVDQEGQRVGFALGSISDLYADLIEDSPDRPSITE